MNFEWREAEKKLRNYEWRELEEAIREVQYGICMLATYFASCRDYDKTAKCSMLYLYFTERVAKPLREFMCCSGLLTSNDFDSINEKMRRKGHTFKDILPEECIPNEI